jgi:lipid A 3-O-deacylase
VGKILRRVKGFVFLLSLACSTIAAAQKGNQPESPDSGHLDYPNLTTSVAMTESRTVTATINGQHDPVAEVRDKRSWEYAPFLNWGTGVGDRSDYKFFWGGFELGKILTPVVHAGILSGQFQLSGNIMPLWQAYTPPPHQETLTCVNSSTGQPVACTLPAGGGTFYGVSLTPVIFRWSFLTKSRRLQPWFQGAGGLIYTTHKYPPNILSNKSTIPPLDEGTSVWNFSPQGGLGIHYFTRGKRSIDFGVNAVHISSASLGDRNPGVNASIQLQVGYSFWR